MHWHYTGTPYLWPPLTALLVSAVLAVCGWRHRHVPGAVPFATMMACALPWELSAALSLSAIEFEARVFWFRSEALWLLPTVAASLWFALAYADLRRWLRRSTLIALAIPPLLALVFGVTNELHHWMWAGFSNAGAIRPQRGPLGEVFVGYGSMVALLTVVVFVRLFVSSPLHRVPVGICLAGQFGSRLTYMLQEVYQVTDPRLELKMLGMALVGIAYALALFRFRLFHLIPIARDTLVEQMPDGVLVLDTERRIVDLNPAAERILGKAAARARGVAASALVPLPEVAGQPGVELEHDGRCYSVSLSLVTSLGGGPAGHLVLVRDITEQKRAQRQLIEQQRAAATLRERDRVARELHDSLGQLFGFVKMQAEAARGWLQRGEGEHADACLSQLAAVAQDAHADVREYILCARTASGGFISALETYTQRYTQASGIAVALELHPDFAAHRLEPMVEVQLLRIIQESLTNVRKHARAAAATVRLCIRDGRAEAVVEDNGAGFATAHLDGPAGQRFGLKFMKDRAEEVGGTVVVDSEPGRGTSVTISVPVST